MEVKEKKLIRLYSTGCIISMLRINFEISYTRSGINKLKHHHLEENKDWVQFCKSIFYTEKGMLKIMEKITKGKLKIT